MYLDISYTAPSSIKRKECRYIDPDTVEVLLLNELVDNPSNTTVKYHHHNVPVLGQFPAGFSSSSTVLTVDDIREVLLKESLGQGSGMDAYLQSQFPCGLDTYIGKELDEVIRYLLFGEHAIYTNYTKSAIVSVYWPNVLFGYWQSSAIKAQKLLEIECSDTIKSALHCQQRIASVLDMLSCHVDLTDPNLKLPLSVSAKLFSRLSVILSIPILPNEQNPLGEFLMTNPTISALERWAEKLNASTRIWSSGVISWRKKYRKSYVQDTSPRNTTVVGTNWWELFGWSGKPVDESMYTSSEDAKDVNKGLNMVFAMSCVCALMFYGSVVLQRDSGPGSS